jgi:hypothetical protein
MPRSKSPSSDTCLLFDRIPAKPANRPPPEPDPPVRTRVTMREIADAQRAVKAATNRQDRSAMVRHLERLTRAREVQRGGMKA